MKTFNAKRNSGFTIIELMIVLVIVAILLAIAYPSYVQYVRKANRSDAQQLLLNWSINQEIWRSNHTTYNDTDGLQPNDTDHYEFGRSGITATTFTLTATPTGDQLKDKARSGVGCNPLTLNQNGQKLPAACWE